VPIGQVVSQFGSGRLRRNCDPRHFTTKLCQSQGELLPLSVMPLERLQNDRNRSALGGGSSEIRKSLLDIGQAVANRSLTLGAVVTSSQMFQGDVERATYDRRSQDLRPQQLSHGVVSG